MVSNTMITALRPLAYTALCFCSFAHTQAWLSGDFRLHGLFAQNITSEAQTAAAPDSYDLERVQLDYNQLFHDNRYYVRVGIHTQEHDVFQIKNGVFEQLAPTLLRPQLTEVSLSVNHQGMVSSYGRIQLPELSDEHDLFQLGIGQRVGTILGRGGYKLGVKASVKQRALGAQIALWQQNTQEDPQSLQAPSLTITPSQLAGQESETLTNLDVSEVAQSLVYRQNDTQNWGRYGWGGRAAYMPYYNPYHSVGGGLGFRVAPLELPVVLAVLYDPYQAPEVAQSRPAQGFYRVVTFQRLQELRVDLLRTYEQFYLRLAGSFQRLPVDKTVSVLVSDSAAGAPVAPPSDNFIFEDTGRSFAYYAEGAYLIGASSYHVCRERAAISGVRGLSHYGALELGVRFGIERYTNILALLQRHGAQDFTTTAGAAQRLKYETAEGFVHDFSLMAVDNSSAGGDSFYITPETKEEYSFFGIGQKKDIVYSYKTSANALSLHLNYYYNEDLRCQLQFESRHYKKNVVSRDPGMVPSPNYDHMTQWQLSVEARF